MSLHASLQYVKYKWLAKGRHGTHSPFVYELIENVVHPHTSNAIVVGKKQVRHYDIVERIVQYFHCKTIHYIAEHTGDIASALSTAQRKGNMFVINNPDDDSIAVIGNKAVHDTDSLPSPDLLWIEHYNPLQWLKIFSRYKNRLLPYSVVAVSNIHKSKLHTACWQRLQQQDDVRMSIDLFRIGLLFFRQEFKIKQDFILKYKPTRHH